MRRVTHTWAYLFAISGLLVGFSIQADFKGVRKKMNEAFDQVERDYETLEKKAESVKDKTSDEFKRTLTELKAKRDELKKELSEIKDDTKEAGKTWTGKFKAALSELKQGVTNASNALKD